jgi:hypothetical protein
MSEAPSNPVHVPDCTQEMLNDLYREHGFDSFLDDQQRCKRIELIPRRSRKPEDTFHSGLTEFEEGAKFRLLDPAGNQLHTVAVIFWYTDVAGKITRVIRSLRVDLLIYDAATHK